VRLLRCGHLPVRPPGCDGSFDHLVSTQHKDAVLKGVYARALERVLTEPPDIPPMDGRPAGGQHDAGESPPR
jgi:hypothetical protein